MVEFSAQRGLCVGNTYFKHRNLHKYTRVARVRDCVETKSMIHVVLVKRDMMRYWRDMRVVKGDGIIPLRPPYCSV